MENFWILTINLQFQGFGTNFQSHHVMLHRHRLRYSIGFLRLFMPKSWSRAYSKYVGYQNVKCICYRDIAPWKNKRLHSIVLFVICSSTERWKMIGFFTHDFKYLQSTNVNIFINYSYSSEQYWELKYYLK